MKIETTYNGNQQELISSDYNGDFKFIVNGYKQDKFQISLDTEDGNAWINVNLMELIGIRDMLNDAIEKLAPLKKSPQQNYSLNFN